MKYFYRSIRGNMESIILYHGSIKKVEKPLFGEGKIYNDYGQGFYLTKDIELAKEWSINENFDGVLNKYSLNIDGLKILDLSSSEYNVLNWLAILLDNRIIELNTPIKKKTNNYILEKYLINYKDYDVIYGYRADDSYFMYARLFISNQISLAQLELAMKLGDLGYQYCLKSKKAFKQLTFLEDELVNNKDYKNKKIERFEKAKRDLEKMLEKEDLDGVFAMHLITEGFKYEDKKL